MQRYVLRTRKFLRDHLRPPANAVTGAFAVTAMKAARAFDPDKTSNLLGRIARGIAPLVSENRIARANLKAAFPEKSKAEIQRILAGSWDNLGRLAAEFAHLDRIWEHDFDAPKESRIDIPKRSRELFEKLRDDGKPALIFSAHLANWELPAVAAAEYGLDTMVVFRPPSIPRVRQAVQEMRDVKMGEMIGTRHETPYRLAKALQEGRHVAMLVDQYFTGGVPVDFFGRRTRANPLLARLLRLVECPVHGTRIVRLPDNRFRAEISEEVPAVRDASGAIDVQGTMQAITSVVEGWVREHPEQWLWQHRRWRDY